jgi:hypothetical protein
MIFENGVYEISTFTVVRRPEGPPVSAEGVRAMPLRAMADAGAAQGVVEDTEFLQAANDLAALGGAELRALGVENDAVLTLVAIQYHAALAKARPVVEAVAMLLDCSVSVASRYIAAAKDAGLIKAEAKPRRH